MAANPYSFNATGQYTNNMLGANGQFGGQTYSANNYNVPNPTTASYQSASSSTSNPSPFDPNTILQGYKDRYARNVNGLDALGTSQQSQIAQQYGQLQSNNAQDMTGRGLSGTTVLDTSKAAITGQQAQAQSDAAAKLQAQKAQLDSQLSGDTLNYMANYRPPNTSTSSSSGSGGGGNGGNPADYYGLSGMAKPGYNFNAAQVIGKGATPDYFGNTNALNNQRAADKTRQGGNSFWN